MPPDEELVILDAKTIESITDHCESYATLRGSMVIGITPVTSMRFAQFCNDQAVLLDLILCRPGEEIVRDLYGMAVRGEIEVGNEKQHTGFRELLGTLLGLYEIKRRQIARRN